MCNRYQQAETEAARRALKVLEVEVFNSAGSIIHPQGRGEVVRLLEGQRTISQMTWGFPLILAAERKRAIELGKLPKPKPVNNARSDKLTSQFWSRWTGTEYRCVIPVQRYAEAYGTKGSMKEAWVSSADEELFAVAGLWRPSDQWGNCYTMIMTDAVGEASKVHSRMPVNLKQESISTWLNDQIERVVDMCGPWDGNAEIEWTNSPWKIG